MWDIGDRVDMKYRGRLVSVCMEDVGDEDYLIT
jgi:hypothetical protein